jgi:hypothetical protein
MLWGRSFPPAMLFIGVYVVGRFPYVGKSVGGFRVVPVRHSYLTLELPKKDDACLSPETCEADKEAAYTEGYKEQCSSWYLADGSYFNEAMSMTNR